MHAANLDQWNLHTRKHFQDWMIKISRFARISWIVFENSEKLIFSFCRIYSKTPDSSFSNLSLLIKESKYKYFIFLSDKYFFCHIIRIDSIILNVWISKFTWCQISFLECLELNMIELFVLKIYLRLLESQMIGVWSPDILFETDFLAWSICKSKFAYPKK